MYIKHLCISTISYFKMRTREEFFSPKTFRLKPAEKL